MDYARLAAMSHHCAVNMVTPVSVGTWNVNITSSVSQTSPLKTRRSLNHTSVCSKGRTWILAQVIKETRQTVITYATDTIFISKRYVSPHATVLCHVAAYHRRVRHKSVLFRAAQGNPHFEARPISAKLSGVELSDSETSIYSVRWCRKIKGRLHTPQL